MAGFVWTWVGVILYALVVPHVTRRSSLQLRPTWNNDVPPVTSMAMAQQTGSPSSAMPSSPPAITSSTPLSPLPDPNEDMDAFVQGISARVTRVALKAGENHENACDTLAKCSNWTLPCLRLACGYGDNDNFTCTPGFYFNPSACFPDGHPSVEGEWCYNLLVNYEEPFLRLPPQEYPAAASDANSTMKPFNQIDHTCILSPLRDILVSSLDIEGYMLSGGIYFGSIVGQFITFPSVNLFVTSSLEKFPFDCEEYDPRHRPWFAEASSPKKRVSVLVDLTNGMDDQISWDGVLAQTLRIDIVKKTLYGLAKTFRQFDSVALTTHPAGIETELEKVLGIDDPNRCANYNASLDRLAANFSSVDLTDGIRRALAKFRTVDGNETEILLVFTRGRINVESAKDVINAYNGGRPGKIPAFLYGVDIGEEGQATFNNLTELAENVSGIARNMGSSDPLLAIYSYFDYLSRFQANAPSPFWAEKYKDAFSLGNITTHVQPVYNSQGHFIGVAAMDVRPQNNSRRFAELAETQNSAVKPFISSSLKDTLNLSKCLSVPCADGLPDVSCTQQNIQLEDVICARSTQWLRHENKCCGECMDPSPPSMEAPPSLPAPSVPVSLSLSGSSTPSPSIPSTPSQGRKSVIERLWFRVTIPVVALIFLSLIGIFCWKGCPQARRSRSTKGQGVVLVPVPKDYI